MKTLRFLFIIYLFIQFHNYPLAQVGFNTQQYFNSFLLNPAMMSIDDKRIISAYSKNVEEKLYSFSFEYPILDLNSNIGFSIEGQTGKSNSGNFFTINKIAFAYSYKFKLSDLTNLRFGFHTSHTAAIVNFPNTKDKWGMHNDYSFGFALVHKKLKVGGSLINLSNKTIANPNSSPFIFNIRSFFVFTSSYEIRMNKNFDLLPGALILMDNRKISLIDFTNYLSIKKKVFLGFTYRDADDEFYRDEKEWIILIGAKFWKKLNFQMSFTNYNIFNNFNKRGKNAQALIQYRF